MAYEWCFFRCEWFKILTVNEEVLGNMKTWRKVLQTLWKRLETSRGWLIVSKDRHGAPVPLSGYLEKLSTNRKAGRHFPHVKKVLQVSTLWVRCLNLVSSGVSPCCWSTSMSWMKTVRGQLTGCWGAVWGWTGLVVVISPVTKFHRVK